uniref:hypothetical protein n=1 Tax=Candidatus Vondammii sp. HM_W22 TaxID=2687299 RepID=UPI002E7B1850|nr:hypothetical protein [Candidatus Vondammii sp. HM_W22]
MASALFIYLVQWVVETSKMLVFWQRTTIVSLLIGLMSLLAPEVMGIGYDRVNAALLGEVRGGFYLWWLHSRCWELWLVLAWVFLAG